MTETQEEITDLLDGSDGMKGKDIHIECIESPESPDEPSSHNTSTEAEVVETDKDEISLLNVVPPTESSKVAGKCFEVELDFESDLGNIKESEENAEDHGFSDKEDGEIYIGEKLEKKKCDKDLEEGEDEGELSDQDDEELEEGELKEKSDSGTGGSASKQPTRQICRFFNRGKCTFGEICRFLHLNNNGRGNYNMFANNINSSERYIPSFSYGEPAMINPRTVVRPENFFIPPPVPIEQCTLESAWEKGLREAKMLVKKAILRKSSPDFEEKRLNLTLSRDVPEKENDKENELNKNEKKKKRENFYKGYEEHEFFEPQSYKRPYDNFEVRYMRDEGRGTTRRERERDSSPSPLGRDKYLKGGVRRWENDWLGERRKAEEYFDPYRRSKSPKGRRSRSRSGSYSSVSSYSYSERGSHSPSYSRSSSGSSCSSRSPSPLSKRKSPNDSVLSPKGENRFPSKKKSGARSSSSRSLSMDSISDSDNSSSGSLVGIKSHIPPLLPKKEDEKPEDEVRAKKLFEELKTLKAKKDIRMLTNKAEDDPDDGTLPDVLGHVPAFPSLQHLLPPEEKEPQVKSLQKQQIKLTLLNKNQNNKFSSLPKELDAVKNKAGDDLSKFNAFQPSVKRPLSPPSPNIPGKSAPTLIPKKSASSRRDELLKQLKAVEDAIARKRAKFC